MATEKGEEMTLKGTKKKKENDRAEDTKKGEETDYRAEDTNKS